MKLRCSNCGQALGFTKSDNEQWDVQKCPICKIRLEHGFKRKPFITYPTPTDAAHAIQDILRSADTLRTVDPDIAEYLYVAAREAKRALRAVLGDDRLEKDAPVIETNELDHFTDTEQCDEQQSNEW